jgi:putative DNA primase/helicase
VADERFTDAGNLDRFVEQHGDRLRYCEGLGSLHYDRRRWATPDAKAAFHEAARVTARSWAVDADRAANPAEAQRLRGWGIKSLSWPRQQAVVEAATLDPRLRVGVDQLDAAPWLLNVRNGTLCLQAGSVGLREHSSDDYLTKLCPVEYDPEARCPRWLEALERTIPDPAERRWFQKFAGYGATGFAFEKALLLAYGPKDTGKTSIINMPRKVLGPEYALAVAEKTIARRQGDEGVPSDVARLRGVRYAVVSETNEGTRLNIGRLKSWTGRNRQVARFMRENEFEFDPAFKLALETNHRPIVTEDDAAFFGRLALLHFATPLQDIDPQFDEALKAEEAGVLNWMVAGCLLWQAEGLDLPPTMVARRDEYRQEQSPVGDFFAECLEFAPTERGVPKSAVYREYQTWAKDNGVAPAFRLSNRRLYALLEEQPGVVAKDGTARVREFWNVRLRERERTGIDRHTEAAY